MKHLIKTLILILIPFISFSQSLGKSGGKTRISPTTGLKKGTKPRQVLMTRTSDSSLVYADLDTIYKINSSQQIDFPLRNFSAKYSDVLSNTPNSTLKIAHFGDSNTSNGSFEGDIKPLLKTLIPVKGWGWFSFNTFDAAPWGGIRTSYGFINKGISDNVITGLDLTHVESSGANDSCVFDYNTAVIEENYFTNATIFASGSGSFTYKLDNGTPVVVNLTSTMAGYSFSTSEGWHKLAITSGGAGQRFYGVTFHSSNPSVVYYKLASSGKSFSDFATINQTALSTQLGAISPNVILLQYGSNDFISGATSHSIMENVRASVDKIKIASPLSDLFFVIPSDRNSPSGTILEKEFSDSLTFYCVKNNYNFIDLFKTYGYQVDAQSLGYFVDEVHFSAKGHELNAKNVFQNLFKYENKNIWKKTGIGTLYYIGAEDSKIQIGRNDALSGGSLDVYTPNQSRVFSYRGNNNTYGEINSGSNTLGLQCIDGIFSRIFSTQTFQIHDQDGLKYNSAGNVLNGGASVTGTLLAELLKLTSLKTAVDDAAAGGVGAVTNEVYKTPTGELRIKL